MQEQNNTILLIADISGFTRFMKYQAISISHSKQIAVKLLKAIMNAAKPPLKVAELEGDAVFFYARANGRTLDKVAAQVKEQLAGLFDAFKRELRSINALRTCTCNACHQATNLQLKQVVHVGRCEIEKIDKFEKLFGLDVIVVHRMLKNSVQANEYVMMTEPMYNTIGDFFGITPERRTESFEGVGEVPTLVFYPRQFPKELTEPMELRSTVWEKLRWRSVLTKNTMMDWLGMLKFKGTFKSMPV
jgi:hypothetical protein